MPFAEFRPISLCNSVYKMISKLMASGLRKISSLPISPKEFGFMEGRQICTQCSAN